MAINVSAIVLDNRPRETINLEFEVFLVKSAFLFINLTVLGTSENSR